MTKQIKIDVLDVGYMVHSAGKQHGYTNLTDLLDGLRGLLSDVPAEADEEWVEWYGLSELPCGIKDSTIVSIQLRNGIVQSPAPAHNWTWRHSGDHGDILRYRVVRS